MASALTKALRELLAAARQACGESSDARVVGERVKVRTFELLDGPPPALIAEVVRRGVAHHISLADLQAEAGSALADVVARYRELCGWSEGASPRARSSRAARPTEAGGAKVEAGMTWEAAEASEDPRAALTPGYSSTPGVEAADSKREVPVDLGAVAEALDDHAPGHAWYLDLVTGDVLPVFEDFEDELLPVPREELEESPRFLNIPPRANRDGWRDMAKFVATVGDRALRQRLSDAIEGKGAFGRFKQALLSAPAERDRWFEWEGERLEEEARAWLASEGIEAVPRAKA